MSRGTGEQIAVNIPLSYQNKQKLLEALTLEERYEVLGAILVNEMQIMQIRRSPEKSRRPELISIKENIFMQRAAEADS